MKLREALRKIAEWELPPTGDTWPGGSPVSYGAKYGSNGERDYMRELARAALAERAYVDADRAQRVPLLQREIFDLWDDARFAEGSSVENFARAIERAHGIGAKP